MFLRAMVQTVVFVVVMGALLLIPAGDWRWPQAWLFLIQMTANSVVFCAWLARTDPALLEARLSGPTAKGQAAWDRVFILTVMSGFLSWLVLMALDARRFGWSNLGLWPQIAGAILTQACFLLVWPVFRVNSFAAPQVRHQAERGQRVVSEGPYRWVRHPMYSAAILYFLGVPLQLGSGWGLACAPLFIAAMGVRAIGEERVLRRALDGYDDYARRVRFRFVPGVW
jgi:protein-S-isoprenylcysteine O-methyltransferase Ste14